MTKPQTAPNTTREAIYAKLPAPMHALTGAWLEIAEAYVKPRLEPDGDLTQRYWDELPRFVSTLVAADFPDRPSAAWPLLRLFVDLGAATPCGLGDAFQALIEAAKHTIENSPGGTVEDALSRLYYVAEIGAAENDTAPDVVMRAIADIKDWHREGGAFAEERRARAREVAA